MNDQPEMLKRVFANWHHISIRLRRRYWRETDYGARLPSFELLVELDAAIPKKDEGAS